MNEHFSMVVDVGALILSRFGENKFLAEVARTLGLHECINFDPSSQGEARGYKRDQHEEADAKTN